MARIPLFIHTPRMAQGNVRKSCLTQNIDLFPTILEMAGQAKLPGANAQNPQENPWADSLREGWECPELCDLWLVWYACEYYRRNIYVFPGGSEGERSSLRLYGNPRFLSYIFGIWYG